MAKRPLPSPALLRQLLNYDPETGRLIWLPRPISMFNGPTARFQESTCSNWNNRYAGQEAFIGIDGAGYRQGCIFAHYLKAHRVAWAIHHDAWPTGEIDHINGDNQDNRIANLRDVTHAENLRNCRLAVSNTSGVTGVHWDKRLTKWIATITVNKKVIRIGMFSELDDAASARKAASIKFGFSPSHAEVRNTIRKFIPKSER